MSKLRETFSYKELLLWWSALQHHIKRSTSRGVDGVSKEDFQSNLEPNIRNISRGILRGEFRFAPLRPILIPKEPEGFRVINVPTIRDRFVQRVLFQVLIDRYGDVWRLPYSFSSMGEESTKKILDSVVRQCEPRSWVIKTDISKYFDSISRAEMKQVIRKEVTYRSLHPLLDNIVDSEHQAKDAFQQKLIKENGIKKGVGLRQGMTLSPIFAYLFLRREDETMGTNGYFRYVDDALIIGNSRQEVEARFEQLKTLLVARALKLHPPGTPTDKPKTAIYRPLEPFEFLGVTLARTHDRIRFLIPKKSKDRIVKTISTRADYKSLRPRQQNGWVSDTATFARDLVRNYRSTYQFCENWNELELLLIERQSFLANEIVKTLAPLAEPRRSPQDQYTLLKLFGIRS